MVRILNAPTRTRAVARYFSNNSLEAGHGRRALHGGAASIIARCLIAVIQVGSVICLARLLSPEDYGLVSMITAITGFAPLLVSLGTPDAVVQRAQIGEQEISTLFWISFSVGCAAMLAVAAGGPLIARFYGEPRLTMVAAVSAWSFLASGLTCQHYALMRRAMKFQELSIIEVAANLFSAGATVLLAVWGFHYWALVMRPVAMHSLLAGGVWLRCGWLPSRPRMTPAVREMLTFGLNSTGFTLTDFAGRSADKMAIGYRAGATSLGYYQSADFLYNNVLDVIVAPLFGVATASLSKVRHDLAEFRRLWGKGLSTLAFFSMPVFGILAITSQDVVVLLLGAKWSHGGTLLAILALRGIPHTIERSLGWLHVAAGRTDRWMRWGVGAAGIQLAALLCGLQFGATGVVIAYVACTFVLFIPAIAYAGRPLNIGAADVIRAVWRPLAGSLSAAAVGFVIRHTVLADVSNVVRAAALTLIYLVMYFTMVVGMFRVRMPLNVLALLMREIVPARFARAV